MNAAQAMLFRWVLQLGISVHIKVEGQTTSERDAAMTRDSGYDVLRYMMVEEQRIKYGDNYDPRISATQRVGSAGTHKCWIHLMLNTLA